MDTFTKLEFDGGCFNLDTRVEGGVLSYAFGQPALCVFTLPESAPPAQTILDTAYSMDAKAQQLVKGTSGFDTGPSVYWTAPWVWDTVHREMRVLTSIFIPDELPIEQILEIFYNMGFDPRVVWAEAARVMGIRKALGITPSDAWAKLEGIAEELAPEAAGEEPEKFCGNA